MNNSSNTDFYGISTHEWIGVVLPYDSQSEQLDGTAGWGYRYRVAIMGYHPYQGSIKDKEITFALVALGVSDGSGAGGRKKDPAISQGDVVLGKFLDSDARQTPIILHVLARPDIAQPFGNGRFDMKTGYVGNLIQQNLLNFSGAQGNKETSGNRGLNLPIGIKPVDPQKAQAPMEQLEQQGVNPNENKVGAIKDPVHETEEFTYIDPKTGIEMTGRKEKSQSTTVAERNIKRVLFEQAIKTILVNNEVITSEQWDKEYETYISGDVDPSTKATDMIKKLQTISNALPLVTNKKIESKFNPDGTPNEEWARQQIQSKGYQVKTQREIEDPEPPKVLDSGRRNPEWDAWNEREKEFLRNNPDSSES